MIQVVNLVDISFLLYSNLQLKSGNSSFVKGVIPKESLHIYVHSRKLGDYKLLFNSIHVLHLYHNLQMWMRRIRVGLDVDENIRRKLVWNSFNSERGAIHALNTQRNQACLRQGVINKQAISIVILHSLTFAIVKAPPQPHRNWNS